LTNRAGGRSILVTYREAAMFEEAVRASEAMREGAEHMHGRLTPALKGCPHCRTSQMIAAPVLGTCAECGNELQVLSEPAS
jgi:hypothetical protein